MPTAEKESAISQHSHRDLSGATGRAGAIVRRCRLHPFGADLVELVGAIFVTGDLLDEDRRLLVIVEVGGVVLCPSNGHLKQPPFFGVLVGLGFRQYQVQQRFIFDFRREPIGFIVDVNHDHEIRFFALAAVHGFENEPVRQVLPGHGLEELGFGEIGVIGLFGGVFPSGNGLFSGDPAGLICVYASVPGYFPWSAALSLQPGRTRLRCG